VTFTGNVDCSRNPPTASETMKSQPDSSGATARNGTAEMRDRIMTRRGPNRSAAGPPKKPPSPTANKYTDTAMAACASVMPRRVSITGTNVEKLLAVNVRRTTMK